MEEGNVIFKLYPYKKLILKSQSETIVQTVTD